ncbi:MAG: DALR domain-containing protein, partial [Methanobacteriota archaeon]
RRAAYPAPTPPPARRPPARHGTAASNAPSARSRARPAPPAPALDSISSERLAALGREFDEAMDDDFNTPLALTKLLEAVAVVNRYVAGEGRDADVAGIDPWVPQRDPLAKAHEFLSRAAGEGFAVLPEPGAAATGGDVQPLLDLLVEVREAARKARAFAIADTIRDRLAGLGFAIEDTPHGPKVVRKSGK